MKKECRLCLGSNHHPHSHLSTARGWLQQMFADIRFAPEEQTVPVDFASPAPFVNQVAVLTTELEARTVRTLLKDIEERCGRSTTDKALGVVKIDIDLLQYGREVLKPADLRRDYVRRGLAYLTPPPPDAAVSGAPKEPTE